MVAEADIGQSGEFKIGTYLERRVHNLSEHIAERKIGHFGVVFCM